VMIREIKCATIVYGGPSKVIYDMFFGRLFTLADHEDVIR